MTTMTDIEDAAQALRDAGLPRTPPHVIVTRWLALLAGDQPIFLDVAHHSGKDVPGASYTFVAVTDATVCYLHAEHDDQFWEHEQRVFSPRREDVAVRALVAWRRPLTQVTEIGIGGDDWQWLPQPDGTSARSSTSYVLRFGGDSIDIPLRNPHRPSEAPTPDAAPVIGRVTEAWKTSPA